MMPNIGDALKRAVEQKPGEAGQDKSRAKPSSVLMNPNRRKIYHHICRQPCSTLGQISTGTSISRSSSKWHLDSLAESDYIMEFSLDGKSHYCPRGLISGKNLQLFATMARKSIRHIYSAIVQHPGSDAGTLASFLEMPVSHIRKGIIDLLDVGLIMRMTDGRHLRHFPTDRLNEAMGEESRTRKEFIRNLVKRLSEEHLKPEQADLKGPDYIISITILGHKDNIVIPAHLSKY